MYFGIFFRHVGKCLWSSAGSETVVFIFSLIFKSVGREREVFVRGARLSFVSAEINEAQGRHRAAGDEPTKKYRIRVQLKISRHLRKIQKIKIGSTWLDSNPGQKILDQLELIKIQKKISYQIFTIQRSKNPLIFGFCRPLEIRNNRLEISFLFGNFYDLLEGVLVRLSYVWLESFKIKNLNFLRNS